MEKRRTEDEFEFFLKNRSNEADSEKHNRTFLDFIPYPMAVLTLDGLVSYLNPAFTDIFGWTLEEMKGKSIPYFPPDLEEETKKNLHTLECEYCTSK